jgi:hypothetical protein
MPRTRSLPPAYSPCPRCGAMVLTGATPAGVQVALETSIRTYTVLWPEAQGQPRLHESRAYPVHRCVPAAAGPTPPPEA